MTKRFSDEAGRDSEGQFQRILEKLPVAAYTCDAEGLITFFNRHALEAWGRAPLLNNPRDRYCGSFKLFALDGTPVPHDECWMARALKTGEEFNGQEIVVERPDGSRRTVRAHASPMFDKSGRLTGAVNILVDISDRAQSEAAQALLAAIVESSDDAIISKSLEGRILTWNAGAEQLFGYLSYEAIGAPITIIIPQDRQDEEREILSRIRRGERIEHFETVRVSKFGRPLNISLTISPIRDSSGRIIGASKVARDITARKEAEAALTRLKDELTVQVGDLRRLHDMSTRLAAHVELQPILEETLRTAVAIDGAHLGLLSIFRPEENRLVVGASVGFSKFELEALERIPSNAGARGFCFQQRRRVIVEDVETDPLFMPFRDEARQAGFRAVHSTPLITRGGKIVGVLSTYFREPHQASDRTTRLIDLCIRQAVDFIENARLFDQLREADRRKDEFLATLAHELRSPLAPLRNSLNILRLSDDLDPVVERVREIMDQQVSQMVRLVDDLSDVSRIASGKVELRRELVDLSMIVANAVETSRPRIEAAGHQLAISLPEERLTLNADPARLTQVIANLLNNAAKYTEPPGQIWLTVRLEGTEGVLSVRDNGSGISSEMLPHIFNMYTQVERTLKRADGGLGLGLTLVRSFVELHGGKIEAHSEGIGKGSEFTLRLPVTFQHLPVKHAEPASPAIQKQLPVHQILIVDDTRASIFTLTKLLEKMGQKVWAAHSAEEGLEIARQQRPQIIFSDIGMPRIDGYELARRLRREPSLDGVVLVALTGYGQESDRQRVQEAGFNHHLVKPVSLESLADLLASIPIGDSSRDQALVRLSIGNV